MIAKDGGCSWDKNKPNPKLDRDGKLHGNYADPCPVKLSKTNVTVYAKRAARTGAKYTLIHSPLGFEGNASAKDDDEEIIIHHWILRKVNEDEVDLVAELEHKKTNPSKLKVLSQELEQVFYWQNQGLDCIMGKIEEEDLLIGVRKGRIGAFCGFSANKSEYKTGSDVGIDMFAMSTMAGAGTVMEVVGKELTLGAFGEYGNGNSKTHSNSKIRYIGGGLLARYDLSKDESGGRKIYGELVLRT
ncbi:hypothetical protein AGMMS49921_04420 [Endomicrobiia bacterium]|nr:hypothetical protein AGMMS49921_04420 [Endomicrobiia bacterium]